MKLTKKEFKEFARKRGFTAHYSGRLKKHFFKPTFIKMDIHSIINKKPIS